MSNKQSFGSAVEEAKRRCRGVIERLEGGLRLSPSCNNTLHRLVHSELSFLSRFSLSSLNPDPNSFLSVNIGHLEAVVHVLQQPFVTGVSRVCKPVPLPPSVENGVKTTAYVDIVCTLNGNPVWFIISDRNPKYISWDGSGSCRNKGLRTRIEQVLDAARSSIALKPSSIILFFSSGLENSVLKKLQDEFGAANFELEFSHFDRGFSEEVEDDWIDIVARSYQQACVLEVKVDCSEIGISSKIEGYAKEPFLGSFKPDFPDEYRDVNLGGSFCSLMSQLKLCYWDVENAGFGLAEDLHNEVSLINFDTTALIAIVLGISNGNAKRLLATPENELSDQFKVNTKFVIAQAMSEIRHPIHLELGSLISGKRGGIICESVFSEFKELVSMCGGPNEKLRASHLIKHLMIVPDSPSVRMMSLPTTRKLALKNKVVFGTGDYWHAPTLTANRAFVRAISQMGMSLFTIEHRPMALTGD